MYFQHSLLFVLTQRRNLKFFRDAYLGCLFLLGSQAIASFEFCGACINTTPQLVTCHYHLHP